MERRAALPGKGRGNGAQPWEPLRAAGGYLHSEPLPAVFFNSLLNEQIAYCQAHTGHGWATQNFPSHFNIALLYLQKMV